MRYLKDPTGAYYGVIQKRSVVSAILLSIPLIRNLYAVKADVSVTAIDMVGQPMIGVHRTIWVFRNQKEVFLKFREPIYSYDTAYLSLDIANTGTYSSKLPKGDYKQWEEYSGSIKLKQS